MYPLPEPFYTNEKGTFGEITARKRWPTIIDNCIRDLEEVECEGASHDQRKALVGELSALKHDIESDAALPMDPQCHWLSGPWLYMEVQLYRHINELFARYTEWKGFDMFGLAKRGAFLQSEDGVLELTRWMEESVLSRQLHEIAEDELQLLFREFVEISLWGNATDLSLLTNVSLEDLKSIQGKKAREEAEKRILVNDTDALWAQLSRKKKGRVDFVLDNAGFELFTDVVFALFLIYSGLATQVVFHCKSEPYMVSDTMIKDVEQLLTDLTDPTVFSQREHLDSFVSRVRTAIEKGQLVVKDDPIWTQPRDFWEFVPGHHMYEELSQSDLCIFKGDLNYRKLTGDRKWARDTPWEVAIGPLAQHGLAIASLRTCKADVVVALPEGVDEQLRKEWEAEGNANGALWVSSGRWAVICSHLKA